MSDQTTSTIGVLRPFVFVEKVMLDLLQPDRGLIGMYMDHITRSDRASETDSVDRVERPRSVRCRTRIDRLPEDQLPSMILISPGTSDVTRGGDGVYQAAYSVGVLAVTQASDEFLGREIVAIQSLAAAALLVQCLPLALPEVSVRWVGETNTDADALGPTDDRSRHSALHEITVYVPAALGDLGEPPTLDGIDPEDNDPGQLDVVEQTNTTIYREPR